MTMKSILIEDTNAENKGRAQEVYDIFQNEVQQSGIQNDVTLATVSDIGLYNKGIVVKLLPDNIFYSNVKNEDVSRIVNASVKEGHVLEDLLYRETKSQHRIALRHCGLIDPDSIEEYIANDGYQALKKALKENSQENVIEEIKKSGLRGRGGGGYPTWMKWNFSKNIKSDQKYFICNADEGDPGAYMDRSMLEGDPHSIIEGMILGGFAVGASQGYFYIRAEYPLAIRRVENAIKQAYDCGLLGKNILGSEFSFDIEIRLGAGAFVCGEETALIASIEGRRGYPSPRPPYPSVKGLWGKPTIINNVETLANVPIIVHKGGDWYSQIGTDRSKGTKVFALTGKVRNSGLVEVPMGTTLRDVVFEIGGGIPDGKKIKAIQTGGPSGGLIPEQYFDTTISYEHLQQLGSIMGSGGMIVMNEDDCIVDIAKFYLGFCVDESCGKCSPCRIGGYQMLNILNKIADGKGELSDLDKLKSISLAMQKASLCGLGQTAPNPVVSSLKYFEEEYKEHILNKKCPAKKCTNLLNFSISEEKCIKCGLCFRNCPVDAISGDKEHGYVIDAQVCTKCGRCAEVCKFDSVIKN